MAQEERVKLDTTRKIEGESGRKETRMENIIERRDWRETSRLWGGEDGVGELGKGGGDGRSWGRRRRIYHHKRSSWTLWALAEDSEVVHLVCL